MVSFLIILLLLLTVYSIGSGGVISAFYTEEDLINDELNPPTQHKRKMLMEDKYSIDPHTLEVTLNRIRSIQNEYDRAKVARRYYRCLNNVEKRYMFSYADMRFYNSWVCRYNTSDSISYDKRLMAEEELRLDELLLAACGYCLPSQQRAQKIRDEKITSDEEYLTENNTMLI